MNKMLLLMAFCAFISAQIQANPIPTATEMIILHNNDMHARFEQTSASSNSCSPEDSAANKCYGGFARVAHLVRKYRNETKNGGPPVLYLNAGDTYTGTAWFAVFKDKIASDFLNKLQPDAISLGNHELDENVKGLVPFLNNVGFPVLACNLNLTGAPEIAQTKHFANSTILDVNGTKIGIIGYLTPETKNLTPVNPVEFYPEIDSINIESAKLKAQGIKIFIALGHSGYQMDQEIARQCPDIDLVIGGHTNTFLYNEAQPDTERIEGPYPTQVKQPSGKMVPVVQAYAYTKYLGKLHVKFDTDGNLIHFDGSPILLNGSIPREQDMLDLLERYRPNITALEKSVVGHTKVYLDNSCRKLECNLGNLIADSMIMARVLENQGGTYWTDAAIAFIMGGGIRTSVQKRSDGSILESDILTILPFNNDLRMTSVLGSNIRRNLEHAATIRSRDSNGGFLQMSGVHATYDYRLPEGQRVTSVDVRCADCDIPTYKALDDNKLYNVIIPQFLAEGGDGHVFTNSTPTQRLTLTDQKALVEYLKNHEFVYPEVEGRLIIVEGDTSSATTLASSVVTIMLAIWVKTFFH